MSAVSSAPESSSATAGQSLSHGVGLTQDEGQVMGSDLITESEYTHLEHLPAPAISPLTATQAIDLTTSAEDHSLLVRGETTPTLFGEVPDHVLAKIRGEENLNKPKPHTKTRTISQRHPTSAVRVCLEKRFKTTSADIRGDIQSAVCSKYRTVLQHTAEAQDVILHPQIQNWMKTDAAIPFNVPVVAGLFNPVTSMCGQVIQHIPHMTEPKPPQGFMVPRSFPLDVCPEMVLTQAHYVISGNPAEERQWTNIQNAVVAPSASRKVDSAGGSGSSRQKIARSGLSQDQRRERHNKNEKERRKKIRSCCDELNLLVPFCHSETDKLTTLLWTTAFLGFIDKTYGDTFKMEFQRAFNDETGPLLKSRPSSGKDSIHLDMNQSIDLGFEQ